MISRALFWDQRSTVRFATIVKHKKTIKTKMQIMTVYLIRNSLLSRFSSIIRQPKMRDKIVVKRDLQAKKQQVSKQIRKRRAIPFNWKKKSWECLKVKIEVEGHAIKNWVAVKQEGQHKITTKIRTVNWWLNSNNLRTKTLLVIASIGSGKIKGKIQKPDTIFSKLKAPTIKNSSKLNIK